MPYPIDLISVRLDQTHPASSFENQDVAFIPVTRFNLRLQSSTVNRSSHLEGRHLYESPEYETYWRHRIDIFERVCLPSIANLHPRPDAWYIAFGEIRPTYIQELLERLSDYSWIRPYVSANTNTPGAPSLPQMLSEHLEILGKSWLCSTRFDSDDSLHRQFYEVLDKAISRLRSKGAPDELRCLNLLYGLTETGGDLSVYIRRSMFSSIFEPAAGATGPYRGAHDEIRDHMPLVEIVSNLPMWIYHRHDDSLDPARAMSAQRMPVPEPERLYPLFGLDPATAIAQRREPLAGSAAAEAPSPSAPLHPEQTLVELATALNLVALADWLTEDVGAAVEAAVVWREVESAPRSLLTAPQYIRLAEQLVDAEEFLSALRAFERASLLAPADLDIRARRDDLAGSSMTRLDMRAQLALGAEWQAGERASAVVIVVSASLLDEPVAAWQALRERAQMAAQSGFEVLVLVLSPLPGANEMESLPFLPDTQVTYEWLTLPAEDCTSADQWQSTVDRELARRIAPMRPCLLSSDGSPAAGSAIASVGRAFGIPLEFGV